jgi:low affinity Fe/Cu permease
MKASPISRLITRVGVLSARPGAFVVVGVYTVAWVILDRKSLDFHGLATLATWLMTLFIQRAEHRDTQAIQAKLDELIRSQDGAHNALTHIDEKEPEEIEQERDATP